MKSVGFAAIMAFVMLAAPGAGMGAAKIDAEKEYSADYARCLNGGDAAKGVTAAMATCINTEYTRQDRRLNAAYQTAMAAQPAARRTALRDAQRAWIKRRDADCAKGMTGGTIDILNRASCYLEVTTVRAVELERMAKGVPKPAAAAAASEARAFAYDRGVVDLLVTGPAAQTLYDRLPGRGLASACGGEGLRKGDGRMICVKAGGDHSCHVWLDVPKQALTQPEIDDC